MYRLLLCPLLLLAATAPLAAQTTPFTKVADTNTPVPGGTGNFVAFSNMISVDADGKVGFSENNVTYVEVGPSQYVPVPSDDNGIYLWTNGDITKVAGLDTIIPGGSGGSFNTFSFFGNSIDDGRLVFRGGEFADPYPQEPTDPFLQNGVYSFFEGNLLKIVDKDTPIPDGMGTFGGFTTAYVDGTAYAFIASDHPYTSTQQGIYLADGMGVLTRIADMTTGVPGIGGTYGWSSQVGFDEGNLSFWANVTGGTNPGNIIGGYTPGGGLVTLASTATAVPGMGTNFTSFSSPAALSGTTVAFRGNYTGGGFGIFTVDLAVDPITITARVSKGTAAPGGGGAFTALGSWSIAGDDVAFRGETATRKGIYLHQNGGLRKVITTADRLDEKVITDLALFENSFSGEYLGFQATFAGGSKGIYLLEVAELVDSPDPDPDLAKQAALEKAKLKMTIKKLTDKMKLARKSGKAAKAKRFLAKLKKAKKQLRML